MPPFADVVQCGHDSAHRVYLKAASLNECFCGFGNVVRECLGHAVQLVETESLVFESVV